MEVIRSELAYDFPTARSESEYNSWLQKKLELSLADPQPVIILDELDARMAARIQALGERS